MTSCLSSLLDFNLRVVTAIDKDHPSHSCVLGGTLKQIVHVQQAFEAALVQTEHLHSGFRRHGRCTRLVANQGQFTKIVTDAI
mmetsp:Transcript_26015/g.60128  ORF Transcript_26015/g.60128 Transcript_26015/m.60128 type:complete len:83 (-) Transcript_26015:1126-1374(-)